MEQPRHIAASTVKTSTAVHQHEIAWLAKDMFEDAWSMRMLQYLSCDRLG